MHTFNAQNLGARKVFLQRKAVLQRLSFGFTVCIHVGAREQGKNVCHLPWAILVI